MSFKLQRYFDSTRLSFGTKSLRFQKVWLTVAELRSVDEVDWLFQLPTPIFRVIDEWGEVLR